MVLPVPEPYSEWLQSKMKDSHWWANELLLWRNAPHSPKQQQLTLVIHTKSFIFLEVYLDKGYLVCQQCWPAYLKNAEEGGRFEFVIYSCSVLLLISHVAQCSGLDYYLFFESNIHTANYFCSQTSIIYCMLYKLK